MKAISWLLAALLFGNAAPPHTAAQRRSLVGGLKNRNLVSGCGCYFSFGTEARPGKEMLVGSAADEYVWMNIDGVDTRLKLVSRTEPTRTNARGEIKVGSRHTERYAAGGTTVDVFYIVTGVCAPGEPQCESIGYSAVFKVRKGRRTQTVRGNGACGC